MELDIRIEDYSDLSNQFGRAYNIISNGCSIGNNCIKLYDSLYNIFQ